MPWMPPKYVDATSPPVPVMMWLFCNLGSMNLRMLASGQTFTGWSTTPSSGFSDPHMLLVVNGYSNGQSKGHNLHSHEAEACK